MPALTSSERKKCYIARDRYFQCKNTDKNKDKNKDKNTDKNKDKKDCGQILKEYEEACPKAWVSYFNKKQIYDAYKDKLQNDGAVYTDEK